uniref:BRO1 domain-containing protein n=1 Tax=Aureoumbra lagunensis TaxID=44058 RepID=A0A7S3K6B7_9STRA|mmetsp:Transcript_13485/g.20127  ORF Transcript_13485/g.20127 Transcript_13485/m.20127 type:complete len:702 (+) Transcript_13485:45-2150(+)
MKIVFLLLSNVFITWCEEPVVIMHSKNTTTSGDDESTGHWVILALEKDVRQALSKANATMPVDEATLSAALHRSASKVLSEAALHQSPQWTLLSALQQGYERVRWLNAESIENSLTKLIDETLVDLSLGDNDTSTTEAIALRTWRSKAGVWASKNYATAYARAESNFLQAAGVALRPGYFQIAKDALASGLGDDDTVRTEEALVKQLKSAQDIAFRAIVNARRNAYFSQKNESMNQSVPIVIKNYATDLAADAVAKSNYRKENQAKAERIRNLVLDDALSALEKCLAATSTGAKLGLAEIGAGRVCEAEASMRWLEIEEDRPELDLRMIRAKRRDAAAKRLERFREAGENAKRVVQKYLNVSAPTLRSHFDKHGCSNEFQFIAEETLNKCEVSANKAIDTLVRDAVKAANKVLGLTIDTQQNTQVEALVAEKAEPLRATVKRWHSEAALKSAQASTDCARKAISTISRKVKRAQRVAQSASNKDAISFLIRHYAYRPPSTDLFSVPSTAIVDGEVCTGPGTKHPDYQRELKELRTRAADAKRRHDARLNEARATISLIVIAAAILDLVVLLCCGPLCFGASWASTTNGLARSSPIFHAILCLTLVALGILALMEFSLRLQDPYILGEFNNHQNADNLIKKHSSFWWSLSKPIFSRHGAGHLFAVFVVFLFHFLCCCSCCCSRLGRKANRKFKLSKEDDHIL